jgi:hypothetical protein
MLTGLYTLVAAAAFFWVPKHCVLMKEEIHLANDVLRACFHALKASFTLTGVELNVPSSTAANLAFFRFHCFSYVRPGFSFFLNSYHRPA